VDNYVVLAARGVVGGLLVLAGVGKVLGASRFTAIVASLRVLPSSLNGPMSRTIPVAEVVAGVMLLIGGNSMAAVCAILLLASFGAAIAVNIVRGRTDLDCGCFGGTGGLLHWGQVWRNAGLIVITTSLLWPAGAAAFGAAGAALLVWSFRVTRISGMPRAT
jgi:hypothetical protein